MFLYLIIHHLIDLRRVRRSYHGMSRTEMATRSLNTSTRKKKERAFYETLDVQTSAKIEEEARNSLRTLPTKRPFTPMDKTVAIIGTLTLSPLQDLTIWWSSPYSWTCTPCRMQRKLTSNLPAGHSSVMTCDETVGGLVEHTISILRSINRSIKDRCGNQAHSQKFALGGSDFDDA